MEPNEMSNEELIFKYFYSGCDNAGEHATMAVEIQNRLRSIDGMIERPTVEAFMLTPNAKGSSGLYVNEVWCGDLPNAEAYILVKRLTKALGMDDSTNTKEPQ